MRRASSTTTGSGTAEPRLYHVSASDKKPLLDFITGALRQAGCRILYQSEPNEAPFRVTFETVDGERMGIMVYAFLANQKLTKNRPDDEHRFQVKYGSKDGELHELWQDPYHLYTTLFVGINPEQGFFVGADPVLHSPIETPETFIIGGADVDEIIDRGWHAWEREQLPEQADLDPPVEILVGGTSDRFLDFVRFESAALSEDQGIRHLLADRFARKGAA